MAFLMKKHVFPEKNSQKPEKMEKIKGKSDNPHIKQYTL